MKFHIEGNIRERKFSLEVEARSAKHARELALVSLGSKEGVSGLQVQITKVEEQKK